MVTFWEQAQQAMGGYREGTGNRVSHERCGVDRRRPCRPCSLCWLYASTRQLFQNVQSNPDHLTSNYKNAFQGEIILRKT